MWGTTWGDIEDILLVQDWRCFRIYLVANQYHLWSERCPRLVVAEDESLAAHRYEALSLKSKRVDYATNLWRKPEKCKGLRFLG